ncbi:MAG: hypothetical protein FE038_00135 [Thermoplasmata archaeon]|nr:MAG: hypothetical protein FE038_00135 [Thermoplasmata archaeon]MCD6108124.1 small multi-drug export protein [Thermoplasmata archaeon]
MKEKEVDFIAVVKFFLPIDIGLLGLLIIVLTLPKNLWIKLLPLMGIYFFPPFGKESVIPLGVFGGNVTVPILNWHVQTVSIDPFIMTLSIAFIDIVVSLFIVWNYDLAKKIPLIGKFIIRVESLGKKTVKEYGWIKPLRFIGVVLFVMIPFQGTGGVVGSIVGRLIGMNPLETWLAVSAGAVAGCAILAYFYKIIFGINIVLGLILMIVVFSAFAIYSIKRRKTIS